MSVKEIKEAIDKDKVIFGIKEIQKAVKKDPKKHPIKRVFIAKDAREETKNKLSAIKIEFETLKSKADMAKELKLEFESEVIALK